MTNKTLKVLIGDDIFARKDLPEDYVEDFSFLLIEGISSITGIKNESYLENSSCSGSGIYQYKNIPLTERNGLELHLVSYPEQILERADESFDWIVTDLNYGRKNPLEGKEVITSLANPYHSKINAKKVIFTSELDYSIRSELRVLRGRAHLIGPREGYTKVCELGKLIGRTHFYEPDLVPQVLLDDQFFGKFVLISYLGRNYLRSDFEGRDSHGIIAESFKRELEEKGLRVGTSMEAGSISEEEMRGSNDLFVKGGGHIEFYKDEIILNGHSIEYGACDKEYSGELIKKIFLDRKIIIQD